MKTQLHVALALALGLAMLPSIAPAQQTTAPGFSCVKLAHRQPLPEAPGTTFRVERMTFTAEHVPVEHHHPGTEIIYLLSGSGTDTIDGSTTALSKTSALIIPPGTYHTLAPSPGAKLSVLTVQFSNKTQAEYQPRKTGPKICQD